MPNSRVDEMLVNGVILDPTGRLAPLGEQQKLAADSRVKSHPASRRFGLVLVGLGPNQENGREFEPPELEKFEPHVQHGTRYPKQERAIVGRQVVDEISEFPQLLQAHAGVLVRRRTCHFLHLVFPWRVRVNYIVGWFEVGFRGWATAMLHIHLLSLNPSANDGFKTVNINRKPKSNSIS